MNPTLTPASPRVAIIMATYNGERYLEAQLDSLLAQTVRVDEILIADDNSRDQTADILDRYQAQHPCISVVKNASNLGVNENFRQGILRSKSDLIFLSDQDDIWHPEKVATLIEQLGSHDLIYSDAEIIDGDGKVTYPSESHYFKFSCIADQAPFYFLFNNCVSGHNIAMRRDFAHQALAATVPAGMLYDQWLALAASLGRGLVYCPTALCQHRIHASNANNNLALKPQRKRSKHEDFVFKTERSLQGFAEIFERLTAMFPSKKEFLQLVAALVEHHQQVRHCGFNLELYRRLKAEQAKITEMASSRKESRKLFKLCVGGMWWWLRYL